MLGLLLVLRYLLLSAAFLFVVIYWAEYNCVYFILACGISLAVLLNLVVFQSEGLLSFSQSPLSWLGRSPWVIQQLLQLAPDMG